MTEQNFNLGFATIVNAFIAAAPKVSPQTTDIYWQTLQEIPDDLWKAGVQRCLRVCKFFPSIAELGEACLNGHLVEPFKYNPHCYNEPKVFEWPDALKRVLIARSRPAEIAVEPAEVLPPPTRREARQILNSLIVKFKEDPATAPAAAFLESQEKLNDRNGKRKDGDPPKWTQ